MVNFGQSPFKYPPANVHRTPNPCFIRSHTNGPGASLGYEDSKELFSMGRIDAEWMNRCTTRSSHSTVDIDNRRPEVDEESEADLFDIVLERMSKSPSTFSSANQGLLFKREL
ncbi:SPla/RYanodine receptor (SPRY) domain-containing protein [Thalictrum thalictroides]|uniref:SPla/RYanodine receptor (SPRY) domain-containing protein n=1 Tax=Thalictrum thalictroides TaxID=46969 RepID=A0A7J6WEQ4_THATH|nr:SPla/RYanodine receptor (SPRY) domain-containing protein [Thalictrum thalictroides]